MPNLAAILKEEIRRLARKEVKMLTTSTRRAVASYRREIARLKRLLGEQQRKLELLEQLEKKRLAQGEETVLPQEQENVRFSARSVRAQRKRLKLSAEQFARLLGVSPLTIYNWEHGKARPRAAGLKALVAVRSIGRREALRRLELLDAGSGKETSGKKVG
jgi:DNA-binding transcriptional regulator YiaG